MAKYNVGDVIQLPEDLVEPGHDRARIDAVNDLDDYGIPTYKVTCLCEELTADLSQDYVDNTTSLAE